MQGMLDETDPLDIDSNRVQSLFLNRAVFQVLTEMHAHLNIIMKKRAKCFRAASETG